jgi:hypothetical protein
VKATDQQSPWLRLTKAMRPNLLVKALSGAAVIWIWLPDDRSHAGAIHRAFQQQCWSEDGLAGAGVLLAGLVFALPVMLVADGVGTWRCGARVRFETGKSRWAQLAEQIGLATRLAVPPPWYYVFELYQDTHRRRAAEYLYRTETKSGIYDMLRRRFASKDSTNALRDKAVFARHCETHGLAVITALATACAGDIRCADGSTELPRRDLFFKPIRGAGGRGASCWFYQADGSYRGSDGMRIAAGALTQHLQELSREENYVVRRYARNHREMVDLSSGALNTLRVLTCLDEHGRPEVTHAVLRMARDPAVVVDNFHAGGIAAKVDIATGIIGPATDMGFRRDSRWWNTHPTTGAPITDRVVPRWFEAAALAIRAHAAFADQVTIGWDIAVLDDGVYLVEGNKSPDLDIIQRVGQEPAGNSRFGELLALHLQRAFPKPDLAR